MHKFLSKLKLKFDELFFRKIERLSSKIKEKSQDLNERVKSE